MWRKKTASHSLLDLKDKYLCISSQFEFGGQKTVGTYTYRTRVDAEMRRFRFLYA